jgi:hypothetical protein
MLMLPPISVPILSVVVSRIVVIRYNNRHGDFVHRELVGALLARLFKFVEPADLLLSVVLDWHFGGRKRNLICGVAAD